ncbi:hypothetical protein ABWK31_00450 [Bacillus sp. JJ353]
MPKYRKKPVEVEAVKFEVTSYSICEIAILAGDQTILFGLENDSPVLRIPTKEGEMIARVGDYIIKGVEGEIYACKPKIFEKTYDRVDLLKKARKMAELSGMLTKNGFNFTTEIKDLPDVNPGPIESPEISPASSFEIEREAYKKLIKELIREVLSEEPVTVSLDGEEVGKACFKEASKVMKRQDIEEVRPTAEEIDNYLRKNPSIKSQLIDLLKSRRGGFKK